METLSERQLFGGAITCAIPNRFQCLSDIRQVPDNQEAFADASRDESIIIELLELKHEVADHESAAWFLQDLAREQEAPLEIETVRSLEPSDAPWMDPSILKVIAAGKMPVSKARQGTEANTLVKTYLANLRLRNVSTDMLVSVYEPLYTSAYSESAAAVGAGAGPTMPPNVAGCSSAEETFQLILKTLRIHNWGLFGG